MTNPYLPPTGACDGCGSSSTSCQCDKECECYLCGDDCECVCHREDELINE